MNGREVKEKYMGLRRPQGRRGRVGRKRITVNETGAPANEDRCSGDGGHRHR
jgi:hypothetical protein